MTKFNVGDRVRVSNYPYTLPDSQQTGTVVDERNHGYGVKLDNYGILTDGILTFSPHQMSLIYDETLERLAEAEAKIAALEAEVDTLKQVDKTEVKLTGKLPKIKMFSTEEFDEAFAKIAKSVGRSIQTPNQRRADVIQRAKMFVADLERRAESDDRNGDGNWLFNGRTTKLTFHVNADKGVVTALAHGSFGKKKLYDKAFAKCHPNDVFNANIGKAIAAGKLYGVGIPQEFLDVPNPTEVVDYMKVVTDDGLYTVTPGDYCEDTHGTKECQADSIYAIEGTIIEDTDAVYP